jgi:hypothetical protein
MNLHRNILNAIFFSVYMWEVQHPFCVAESDCNLASFKNDSSIFPLKGSSSKISMPTRYEVGSISHLEEDSGISEYDPGLGNRDLVLYLVFVSKQKFYLGLPQMKGRKCIVLWVGESQGGQNDCGISLAVENATSTTAKNLLYSEALKLDLNGIQYLVMVDGSSQLIELKDYGRSSGAGDPWSTFERYLLEWEPAVGVPHSLSSDYNEVKEVQEIFNFDQAVVAFHIEAAPLLLPFWKFEDDDGTWRPSGAAQATIAHAAFQHHIVQFNALRVLQSNLPSGSTTQKPLKKYVMWGANAFRRLDDFLRIPWDRVDEIGVDQGDPLPRKFSRHPNYCITNILGYFDECHPYFLNANGFKRSGPITSRGRCTRTRFDDFPSVGISQCVDSSQPNQGRYEQRLFLFLQEVFFRLQSVIAVSEGGEDSGFCPHHPPEELRLQITSPQMSDSILERDVHGAHILLTGLPRWSPEVELEECSNRLETSRKLVGSLCIDEVCHNKVLNSLHLHSKRGWPPVQWHCTKHPKGASFVLKQVVLEIQAGSMYNMTVTVWSNCSLSGGILPEDFLVTSRAKCFEAATDSALFSVEYPPSDPVDPSEPTVGSRQADTGDLHVQHRKHSYHDKNRQMARRQTKDFVYLVQCDSCKDLTHLKSDRSEVIQLVWKVPPRIDCPDLDVLYFPNSTLVQGRNRLFFQVQQSFPETSFMYYIFMDGDVTLKEVKDFGFNTGNPWLTFEQYLLEWEPAVGFPHFGAADYDEDSEVQIAFNFDQIVVAYHTETVTLLLPYTERFDNVSWWYCGTVQNALCAALYNNHRMQFNALRALSWESNFSPRYLRASNFLFPLTWISSAIKSLDLLMVIPWFGPSQSATSNLWDSTQRTWVMNGLPKKKGNVQYDLVDMDKLDFCHEYFVDRDLHRMCSLDETSRREITPALAILEHLKTIQSSAGIVETNMLALNRSDLAMQAVQIAEQSKQLMNVVLQTELESRTGGYMLQQGMKQKLSFVTRFGYSHQNEGLKAEALFVKFQQHICRKCELCSVDCGCLLGKNNPPFLLLHSFMMRMEASRASRYRTPLKWVILEISGGFSDILLQLVNGMLLALATGRGLAVTSSMDGHLVSPEVFDGVLKFPTLDELHELLKVIQGSLAVEDDSEVLEFLAFGNWRMELDEFDVVELKFNKSLSPAVLLANPISGEVLGTSFHNMPIFFLSNFIHFGSPGF